MSLCYSSEDEDDEDDEDDGNGNRSATDDDSALIVVPLVTGCGQRGKQQIHIYMYHHIMKPSSDWQAGTLNAKPFSSTNVNPEYSNPTSIRQ